ncbi:hypothetical protein [Natrarchaeobaculum sulfurireducens]|uniref:Uncharacterized protein n=1 Tax=Natrarchaeobaculum sulfurireducens TaxID=2044521 RepID=A0A346PGG5_9EURY|nr:hypothetical protein [Natrarchaeobaculum sulfurireducens]AXR78610.1 hypothetical protein AArc1_2295 [Natrarchaeobaculum sulfurireducens]AXR81339.1 hypothetical protein AArcMg_1323 [Natrarchaeobaculum sulfurireducens]
MPTVTLSGVAIPAIAVVVYGVAVGVFIDLDHFLIARLKTGRWDAVRRCVRDPVIAVADQGQIFERGDVGVLSRLLSHLLVIGVAVPAIALLSLPLAVVTAAVLYAHIVCDVLWDIWRLDQHTDVAASEDDLMQVFR